MLLFLTGLSGQDLSYRGKVSVKTFKTDNHISKSVQAKVLANLNNLPLSESDTLYRTHYICEDTIVIYITGVDQLHQSKEIQIGSKSYLYDHQTFTFIQLPLMERSFSWITAKDWKRYKKRAEISKFDYNYQLIPPRRKAVTYFAALDESVTYPEQLQLEGQFGLLFHPLGRYETLASLQDTMEYVNLYTYESDPKLNCEEHFTDFAIRDAEIDMNKLPGYRPDLEVILYDGIRSDFAKAYHISGIPHYLLLDQQGRIMNANAPRPSDERLQQMLDDILNK